MNSIMTMSVLAAAKLSDLFWTVCRHAFGRLCSFPAEKENADDRGMAVKPTGLNSPKGGGH